MIICFSRVQPYLAKHISYCWATFWICARRGKRKLRWYCFFVNSRLGTTSWILDRLGSETDKCENGLQAFWQFPRTKTDLLYEMEPVDALFRKLPVHRTPVKRRVCWNCHISRVLLQLSLKRAPALSGEFFRRTMWGHASRRSRSVTFPWAGAKSYNLLHLKPVGNNCLYALALSSPRMKTVYVPTEQPLFPFYVLLYISIARQLLYANSCK